MTDPTTPEPVTPKINKNDIDVWEAAKRQRFRDLIPTAVRVLRREAVNPNATEEEREEARTELRQRGIPVEENDQ